MTVKSIFLVLLLVAPFTSTPAHADSPVLTVRQLPNAEYEAVIKYDTDVYCFVNVNPPSSVTVTGYVVRIESPANDFPVACMGVVPPIRYFEESAHIGALSPGMYTVSWVQPGDLSLSISLAVSEFSQQGPLVPCVGCDTLIHAPFPETGAWYNPDQSGSGVNLEMQNGKLVGYYYGYDGEGRPEWRLFNGMLIRSEQEGVQWALETPLLQFKYGNCIGCVYRPPNGPIEGATIRLEFQQRNYMRLTIGESSSQFFVPIIYGSTGHKYFEEQTPYVFPEYGADFVLITKPNSDPPEPWEWTSSIVPIWEGELIESGPNSGKLVYTIWTNSQPPSNDIPMGEIVCELDSESNQPGCVVDFDNKNYIMPIANMSDSRFFGEAADGSTIEGYRIDYD